MHDIIMGQSQSNQAGAANDEKIAKFKALMGSTDPDDRAKLEVYKRELEKITKKIEFEQANIGANYSKNKLISNKNYKNKMNMAEARKKKFKNALEEQAKRNQEVQKSITQSQ